MFVWFSVPLLVIIIIVVVVVAAAPARLLLQYTTTTAATTHVHSKQTVYSKNKKQLAFFTNLKLLSSLSHLDVLFCNLLWVLFNMCNVKNRMNVKPCLYFDIYVHVDYIIVNRSHVTERHCFNSNLPKKMNLNMKLTIWTGHGALR